MNAPIARTTALWLGGFTLFCLRVSRTPWFVAREVAAFWWYLLRSGWHGADN